MEVLDKTMKHVTFKTLSCKLSSTWHNTIFGLSFRCPKIQLSARTTTMSRRPPARTCPAPTTHPMDKWTLPPTTPTDILGWTSPGTTTAVTGLPWRDTITTTTTDTPMTACSSSNNSITCETAAYTEPRQTTATTAEVEKPPSFPSAQHPHPAPALPPHPPTAPTPRACLKWRHRVHPHLSPCKTAKATDWSSSIATWRKTFLDTSVSRSSTRTEILAKRKSGTTLESLEKLSVSGEHSASRKGMCLCGSGRRKPQRIASTVSTRSRWARCLSCLASICSCRRQHRGTLTVICTGSTAYLFSISTWKHSEKSGNVNI